MDQSAVQLQILKLEHGSDLPLPDYESVDAAGMDLRAALPDGKTQTLQPGVRAMIPTGISIALPRGYEAQIRPRSGLAAKHGVTVLNSPGTIDADYRGEIKIILINHGDEPFEIQRGMRIAQMVIAPVVQMNPVEVGVLDDTQRGGGGFGSTGS